MSTVGDVNDHATLMKEHLLQASDASFALVAIERTMKSIERELRAQVTGSNEQARKDSLAALLERSSSYRATIDAQETTERERAAHHAESEYHRMMARAHIAAIGAAHD